MANLRRFLGDLLSALDRALGGERRPTRLQRRVARRPIRLGLCLAVPFALFLLLVSPDDEAGNVPIAVLGGLFLGLLFSVAAGAERLRQRRLRRRGLWDGRS
ncbi:hypothetical protein ACF064_06630 [Streptomyces sp. NPDC015492]|uniref:hypothetical protein n=1 Tax=unclassified Streptomyces TaxID=2593676 RepID=UPI0033DDE1B7